MAGFLAYGWSSLELKSLRSDLISSLDKYLLDDVAEVTQTGPGDNFTQLLSHRSSNDDLSDEEERGSSVHLLLPPETINSQTNSFGIDLR